MIFTTLIVMISLVLNVLVTIYLFREFFFLFISFRAPECILSTLIFIHVTNLKSDFFVSDLQDAEEDPDRAERSRPEGKFADSWLFAIAKLTYCSVGLNIKL